MNKPLIVIDHRERGEVREAFSLLPCQIQLEQLEVADYIVSPDFAIERKRGDDLANSLCDNRFFSQLKKLKKYYSKVAVILEKPRLAFKRKGLYEGSLLGAMVYCAFKECVPIIPTQNETQTAQVVFSFAKREQNRSPKPFFFTPVKVKDKEIKVADQIRLLEGLWKVGKNKSQTLLNCFSSPFRPGHGYTRLIPRRV